MPDDRTHAFRVTAREQAGRTLIAAEGELDLVGAPRLLEAIPADGEGPVVLDLAAVGFMDSSGLRSLLEARQTCIEAGRDFAIARPSGAVTRVLELVDLSREFEVVELPTASG